jgi:hypothetical protein
MSPHCPLLSCVFAPLHLSVRVEDGTRWVKANPRESENFS